MNQTDMFGNPLVIGDFISYPGRTGSSLFVNLAVYLKSKPNGRIQVAIPSTKWVVDSDGVGRNENTFRKTSVEMLSRVIKVPYSFLGNTGMSDNMSRIAFRLLEVQEKILNNDYK